jgi:hypothetical protein
MIQVVKDRKLKNLQEHRWKRAQLGIGTAYCALQECSRHAIAIVRCGNASH